MDQRSESEAQLRDVIAVLRRRKWTIIVVTVLLVALTWYYTEQQTPVYQSTARVVVRPIGPMTYTSFFTGPVNLSTERGVANSLVVAQNAAKEADVSTPPEELQGGLSVGVETDSEILDFTYSSTSPSEAKQMAQAFADGYLDFRREQALEEAKSQGADLKTQSAEIQHKLNALRNKILHTKDPAALASLTGVETSLQVRYGTIQGQLEQLNGTNSLQGGGGEVVQPAELSTAPVSPQPKRNIALAIMLGLALGAALAFGRERLDDRLRSRRDLEHLLGAPVLATIPQVSGWRRKERPELVTLSAPKGNAAEAYRSLRTNVQYAGRKDAIKVITVTSALIGDGKTTTVANLAAGLALAGKRVIAVSCDLRKPRMSAFFDRPNSVGVSSILQGKATLADSLQDTEVDLLRIVASGPIPPDPAELLSSDALDELLNDLREMADFVIFDTPPVLAVADSQILGPKSDGIILVADANNSTRGEVKHVREELEQVGGVIIGGVFNGFDPDRALYYSPEYRHRYANYYEDPESEQAEGAPQEDAVVTDLRNEAG